MSKLTIPVTKHDHIQGDLQAACSLIEYGDYECPSCGEVEPIVRSLQAHFGDLVSLVFRNFPLREIHPWAESAAEVAEFAGTQGKFWEMHDLLFANQESFSESTLQKLVRDLGLSDSKLQQVRSNGTLKNRIDADFAGGIRSGVNGTPTFFINGDRYDGPTDLESMLAFIEQGLNSKGG